MKPNVYLRDGKIQYNAVPIISGISIQHVDGSFYTYDQWVEGGFSKAEANGVAYNDSNIHMVIAKTNIRGTNGASAQLKYGGMGVLVEGLTTETQNDYDGKVNTERLIENLKDTTDTSGTVGAPAAEMAASYTFPCGKNGYLPSIKQAEIFTRYFSQINNHMRLIGGSGITDTGHLVDNQYMLSSTQKDQNYVYAVYYKYGGKVNAVLKDQSWYVRPVMDII